jgi:hypothetical protein
MAMENVFNHDSKTEEDDLLIVSLVGGEDDISAICSYRRQGLDHPHQKLEASFWTI